MTSLDVDAATGHAAIVALAIIALVVIVAGTAVYASDALQIVAYSGIYVIGVTAFWLGYYVLSSRAESRRKELLDAEADD